MREDTIRLLDECSAGISMAIRSIDDVLPSVEDPELLRRLQNSKKAHQHLRVQANAQLRSHAAMEKAPDPIARGMSWLKTNARLAVQPGDRSVADLVIGGCNMGVKSLHKYQNQYPAADPKSRDLADRLISLETELAEELYPYL